MADDLRQIAPAPDMALAVPARSGAVRFRILALACGLAVITYIQRVGFAQAERPLKEGFGLDATQWGDVLAAFMWAYGLFEIPFGILGDRFGVRGLLLTLVLGWSLVTGCTALVG